MQNILHSNQTHNLVFYRQLIQFPGPEPGGRNRDKANHITRKRFFIGEVL